MITIRSPYQKTILLITITTLLIGFGTSLSESDWNSPDDGEKISSDTDINLNITNSSNADWINFTYLTLDHERLNYSDEGDYVTDSNFTIGSSTDDGKHKVAANSSSGDDVVQTFWIDRNAPSIDFTGDFDYLGSDPSVDVEIDDTYLDIDSVNASASGKASVDDVGDCSGSSCDIEIGLDAGDLDQGDEFDIDVTANDTAGNSGSNSKDNVIFDSKWDGDDSANVEWSESGDKTLNAEDEDDKDVDVVFKPDSVSQTTLTCSWDGGESSDTVDSSSEEVKGSCEIDYGDVGGSRFDLTVSAEDEAGQSKELVSDEELVWDASDPGISDLTQSEGLSTFNSGFSLEVEGSDDASGVENLEYYFDEDTSVGDGTSIDFGDSGSMSFDESFDVDTEDLGQGNHTVYVRVEDRVGKTDVESFDFEYFPDRTPTIVLSGSDRFEITSGDKKSYSFSIRNDSPFFVENVDVGGSGVWNGNVSAVNLESGDSKEKVAKIDASGLEPDSRQLSLTSPDNDVSKNVEVIVEASDNQASNINSSIEEWLGKVEAIDRNASRVPTIENENSSLEEFEQKVDDAQAAVKAGDYYLAKQELEGIDSRYQSASNSLERAVEEHQINKRNHLVIIGVIVALLVSVVGFIVYRNVYEEGEGKQELNLEYLKASLAGLKDKDLIENLMDKFEDDGGSNEDNSVGGKKDLSFKDDSGKESEEDGEEGREDEEENDGFEYHYKD